jgi:hypothetical protein
MQHHPSNLCEKRAVVRMSLDLHLLRTVFQQIDQLEALHYSICSVFIATYADC